MLLPLASESRMFAITSLGEERSATTTNQFQA
jgi:hypothetical protein